MASDEVIREAAGRKAYRYSLNDGNSTYLLLLKVGDHVTSDSDVGSELRDEVDASP